MLNERRNRMKRIISILLLLILLTACNVKTAERQVTDADVKRIVNEMIDEERFLILDKEDIDFVLSVSPDEYECAWMWLDKNGSTIDEIAIFVANKENADTLYQKLENYVAACKSDKKEWLESYNPTEALKLKNGKLFRYGNCMGYTFLNEDMQKEFFKEFNDFYSSQE